MRLNEGGGVLLLLVGGLLLGAAWLAGW